MRTLLNSLNIEMSEYWVVGILRCRNIEMSEYWVAGILRCRNIAMSKHWDVGIKTWNHFSIGEDDISWDARTFRWSLDHNELITNFNSGIPIIEMITIIVSAKYQMIYANKFYYVRAIKLPIKHLYKNIYTFFIPKTVFPCRRSSCYISGSFFCRKDVIKVYRRMFTKYK